MKNLFLLLLTGLLVSCQSKEIPSRPFFDLSGNWQFALDTARIGITQRWFASELTDSVTLPGTTDLNKKGFLNKDTTTMHLNRVWKYQGAAWYRKSIVIPENFRDQHLLLILERTKPSKIWVDTTLIGESFLLQSPQQFEVTDYLTPGEHTITLLIDNDLRLTPYGNVHIYSDDTQTNWNGVIGKIGIEASPKSFISDLQVYPNIEKEQISVRLGIENQLNLAQADVELILEKIENGKIERLKSKKFTKTIESLMHLEFSLENQSSLWDEFQQPLYRLTAVISGDQVKDAKSVNFGMRKFAAKGTQFEINGRTTFLRGKHDACVFPLTGHPPMDAEEWVRIFTIAKSYGINHYRFHSWCPPEAAFAAADQVGIYLQAELPFWGGLDSDSIAERVKAEGMAMLKSYANHPSFVMFSHGNEIWSGHDRVEKNILSLKEYDNRPLYTMGSNNGIGYVAPREWCDFFVAARTPSSGDTTLTHTRLTHAFADSREGGILNTQTPSTEIKFTHPVSQIKIPIISHEIGQYQIYPDYREIEKYTGVLEARNLEIFRNRLKKSGMLDQNSDFQKASGAWAALCYKAEMEAALRTDGFGGFQLLDLQDFPGQGTALVGILDAFMESKNVVSQHEWLQSCNDVVLLLEFPKYCWTNAEEFQSKIVVANYSNLAYNQPLSWVIRDSSGKLLNKGTSTTTNFANGGLHSAGEIQFALSGIMKPEKLIIELTLGGTTYRNSYPAWVYPATMTITGTEEIMITQQWDKEVVTRLNNGGKVLLFPTAESVKETSIPGLFPPEFWNYGMFKGISEGNGKPVSPGTMGILTRPEHPLFNAFPTDFHTNWQWFSIIKASNPLILDQTASDYRPIVQVVDNLERNHKLGLIFEFKVGEGKLLVCMAQLPLIIDQPEAIQLYQSILNYMNSGEFDPATTISEEEINRLFKK